MTGVNDEAIEAWNTVLFDKFSRFRHIITAGLGQHGLTVLERHPPPKRGRVLDVGCGFGDSTIHIASLLDGGEAVGIDAAGRFIEGARADAEGLTNVRFEVRDAQVDPLDGPYDHAFARFGTMFFQSPVAALRNVRKALKRDALFTFVVWRKREDNPWMYLAETIVRDLVKEPEKSDAPTCGPGPFSMAGADMVSDQLLLAGFADPTFERVDRDIVIGRDVDDAIDFAMALGPAGEIMRLAGAEAEQKRPEVMAALQRAFADLPHDGGVRARSSVWIIAARATG